MLQLLMRRRVVQGRRSSRRDRNGSQAGEVSKPVRIPTADTRSCVRRFFFPKNDSVFREKAIDGILKAGSFLNSEEGDFDMNTRGKMQCRTVLITDDDGNARRQAHSGKYAVVVFISPKVGKEERLYVSDEAIIAALDAVSYFEQCRSFLPGITVFATELGEAVLRNRLETLLGKTEIREDFLWEDPRPEEDFTGQAFLT